MESPKNPSPNNPELPSRDFELECQSRGYLRVAGVDEVGRGCLAGPVVAAAVILPAGELPEGINDSKMLSPKRRAELSVLIKAIAVAHSIGFSTVEEIDEINILQATRLAMQRAVFALRPSADFLLIDGKDLIDVSIPQRGIIRGDRLSVSIAAASIIAKVYRDDWMTELDAAYPGYEFAKHKGYGSEAHRRHLQAKGLSPVHRKSFAWTPV